MQGRAPWTTATGLVVRGYVSKIERACSRMDLVIPASFTPDRKWRLDTWFHGRGETLSEVNFLVDRQRTPGEFTPPNAIVVHLYGRYCNANKFAGEVDLFETLDAVKTQYPIDENRIVVRGFSMGGAAAWQFAAHYRRRVGGRRARRGLQRDGRFPEGLSKRSRSSRHGGKRSSTTCTMRRITRPISTTVRPWPTAAKIDRQIQAARMMEKALMRKG